MALAEVKTIYESNARDIPAMLRKLADLKIPVVAAVNGAAAGAGAPLALHADFVIAGVGILPGSDLAAAAGIAIDNGIACDAYCHTSAPHVWAAGDCASFPWKEGRLRLESVGNAIDMAEAVAANIMGAGTPYAAQPWFWSDQYDCKLQIAGFNAGYDRIVTRGPEGEAVSFWYFRGDDLLAVDAMNDSRAYMVGKRLIETGRPVAPAVIADPATNLKALLKA